MQTIACIDVHHSIYNLQDVEQEFSHKHCLIICISDDNNNDDDNDEDDDDDESLSLFQLIKPLCIV